MKKWIVANLKLYKTKSETLKWMNDLLALASSKNNIVVCPSPLFVDEAFNAAKKSKIMIGGQDCSTFLGGAFTGEISASALKEEGASVVIVGHSERRRNFNETNKVVNAKLKNALSIGMVAIVCLSGDSKSDPKEEICREVKELLDGVEAKYCSRIIFAYEPVWAIGTGVSMNEQDANRALSQIKAEAKKVLGKAPLAIYGGSVTKDTAEAYLKQKSVDGLLIGKTSKDVNAFAAICNI